MPSLNESIRKWLMPPVGRNLRVALAGASLDDSEAMENFLINTFKKDIPLGYTKNFKGYYQAPVFSLIVDTQILIKFTLDIFMLRDLADESLITELLSCDLIIYTESFLKDWVSKEDQVINHMEYMLSHLQFNRKPWIILISDVQYLFKNKAVKKIYFPTLNDELLKHINQPNEKTELKLSAWGRRMLAGLCNICYYYSKDGNLFSAAHVVNFLFKVEKNNLKTAGGTEFLLNFIHKLLTIDVRAKYSYLVDSGSNAN